MSQEADELAHFAAEVREQSVPVLSSQILRHLGSLLAAVYAQEEDELSATNRFAEPLVKLGAAMVEAENIADADFKRLLVAAIPILRPFALSLTQDPAAADDLVKEVLLRAWRGRARFEQGSNFEAWTFTILRNAFYSGRRKIREIQDEDGRYTARLTPRLIKLAALIFRIFVPLLTKSLRRCGKRWFSSRSTT